TIRISVNGTPLEVPDGVSLAAALLNAGYSAFRTSVMGEARAPICGMGICFECRVTLDGVVGQRACLEPVREGMQVVLDA
ncbi:MAG TPA: (2Fe-2S)-binding protein, partial [Gemmatimonadales bacterium]|nr:(2Fe-2S)-binding protein [Gemmatimonadales bacterium]